MLGNLTTILEDSVSSTGFGNVWSILDFVGAILVVAAASVFICLRIRRFWVTLGYAILDVLFVLSMVFAKLELVTSVSYLPVVSLVMIAVLTIICLSLNSGVLRQYLVKSLKSATTAGAVENKNENKEELIHQVLNAVNWLSTNKVGALITFTRETPLEEFMKSGTVINCPFTAEIVETIFYEGTRLHDGAIIVNGNTIVAAAVYYPPSTKPIPGKFGARHRAALGISEVTDAITIIVSEETGKIAVTHGGLMDNVTSLEFEKYLRNKIL